MKTRFLFPPIFRIIGIVLSLPGFVLGYLMLYERYSIPGFGFIMRKQSTLTLPAYENFTNELTLTLIVVGLSFIAFSRIRHEDELSYKLRLNALYWGVLANFWGWAVFLVLAGINIFYKTIAIQWLVDELGDEMLIISLNLFMPLLICIIRFYYLLLKNKGEYELKEIRLLPHRPFNRVGKILSMILLMLTVAGFLSKELKIFEDLIMILPVPLLIWMYSKERNEDEYVKTMRLDAMQIAVYVNYSILLISNFTFYGIDFLLIQMLNLLTIPLIFQIRFQYLLYKLRMQDKQNGSTIISL